MEQLGQIEYGYDEIGQEDLDGEWEDAPVVRAEQLQQRGSIHRAQMVEQGQPVIREQGNIADLGGIAFDDDADPEGSGDERKSGDEDDHVVDSDHDSYYSDNDDAADIDEDIMPEITDTDAFILALSNSCVKTETPLPYCGTDARLDRVYTKYGTSSVRELTTDKNEFLFRQASKVILLKAYERMFFDGVPVKETVARLKIYDEITEKTKDNNFDIDTFELVGTKLDSKMNEGDTVGLGVNQEYLNELLDFGQMRAQMESSPDTRFLVKLMVQDETSSKLGYTKFEHSHLNKRGDDETKATNKNDNKTLMRHFATQMPAFYSALLPRLAALYELFELTENAGKAFDMIDQLMLQHIKQTGYLQDGTAFTNVIGRQKCTWVLSRLDEVLTRQLTGVSNILVRQAYANGGGLPSVLRTMSSSTPSGLLTTTTQIEDSGFFGTGTARTYMLAIIYAYYAAQAPTFARMLRVQNLAVQNTLVSLAKTGAYKTGSFAGTYNRAKIGYRSQRGGTVRTRAIDGNPARRKNTIAPDLRNDTGAMKSLLFSMLCTPEEDISEDALIRKYYPVFSGYDSRETNGIYIFAQLDPAVLDVAAVMEFLTGAKSFNELRGEGGRSAAELLLLKNLREIAISSPFIMALILDLSRIRGRDRSAILTSEVIVTQYRQVFNASIGLSDGPVVQAGGGTQVFTVQSNDTAGIENYVRTFGGKRSTYYLRNLRGNGL